MLFVFQIVEESQHQRCIQVNKHELFECFAQMTLGKPQQQAKAVAVGGNRLRTRRKRVDQCSCTRTYVSKRPSEI